MSSSLSPRIRRSVLVLGLFSTCPWIVLGSSASSSDCPRHPQASPEVSPVCRPEFAVVSSSSDCARIVPDIPRHPQTCPQFVPQNSPWCPRPRIVLGLSRIVIGSSASSSDCPRLVVELSSVPRSCPRPRIVLGLSSVARPRPRIVLGLSSVPRPRPRPRIVLGFPSDCPRIVLGSSASSSDCPRIVFGLSSDPRIVLGLSCASFVCLCKAKAKQSNAKQS